MTTDQRFLMDDDDDDFVDFDDFTEADGTELDQTARDHILAAVEKSLAAGFDALAGSDDPRTVATPTSGGMFSPSPYPGLIEEHIAQYGQSSLDPQTFADSIRSAFLSGMKLASERSFMMALMFGGDDFARGLAIWWTDAYFKHIASGDEERLRTVGVRPETDRDDGTIALGEMTIDEITTFGHEHFPAILRKEE
jgi:hypothetical protein